MTARLRKKRSLLVSLIVVYSVASFSHLLGTVLTEEESSSSTKYSWNPLDTAPTQQLQKQKQTIYAPRRLPRYKSIVNRTSAEIIGDPQPLLDFAIVGHGKCGTTSLQQWLSTHPEIICPEQEILELSLGKNHETDLLARLYKEFKSSNGSHNIQKTKLGYKNPGEIRIPRSIRFLDRWFGKTILIVGIRHPISWFESLYNFKVQNLQEDLPSNQWGDPNLLIGACRDPFVFDCVGTHKGLFHVHLAMLGKTNQIEHLQKRYRILRNNIVATKNPVFLFDVDQLNDDNATRRNIFKNDFKKLLGLSQELGPIPRLSPGKILSKELQEDRDRHKISICDDKYLPLRAELMEIAREASDFILNRGFLDHQDVTVSSRPYFEHILGTRWTKDPCGATKDETSSKT